VNAVPAIRYERFDTDRAAWRAAAAGFVDRSLMQDWAFGDAKAETGPWRAERGLFTQNGRVVGAVQAMIREVPWIGGGLVWINRGPLWRTPAGESPDRLGALLEVLRARWARGGYYLRVAPPLEGACSAPGFVATGTPGWASARVDLSAPADVLRAGLHQKWRNALNKAERNGPAVSSGVEFFSDFCDGFARFLADKKFPTSLTPQFLARLQERFPPERRMVAHLAHVGGAPAGGALIARYDDTAEYLAGFATEAGHGHNVGQLLLWRALIAAKDAGVRWFDVGGMDEARTPEGIYHFKAGLGGAPYRLAGEIEYCPADPRARLVRWRVRAATGGEPS
jgi:hypothetical protein